MLCLWFFFFSSRRLHTRLTCDWSSDVCSSDLTIALDPAPPVPSYVLVAENWYPDWQASVDGRPTRGGALRGDFALITVPVPAGAHLVELTFRSRDYETGKEISLGSLALLAIIAGAPIVARRARHA